MIKKHQSSQRKNWSRSSDKGNHEQVCHKCVSPDHFIKECPQWDVEYRRYHSDKAKETKHDQVINPNKRMTTREADNAVEKALAVKEKTSSEESDDDEDTKFNHFLQWRNLMKKMPSY